MREFIEGLETYLDSNEDDWKPHSHPADTLVPSHNINEI
jgi:hypothetical protein